MTVPTLRLCVSSIVLTGALLATAEPAAAATTTYADLTGGLGYSSNPRDEVNGQSSGFGRLSVFGLHQWESATGKTTLSGYGENTSYLKDYGSTQIFYVKGHTEQQLSPTASIFGDLNFSGDFAGQLSNRLTNVPSQPPVTEPGNPLPPTDNNPDAFGLSGRQYRLDGHVGSSFQTGPRGTLSASIGAERLMFGGDNGPPSYNIYTGSLGYSHQVSERTGLGGTVYLQRQDFQGGDYANIANPTLTANILLSETLTAKAGAGVLLIHEHRQGFDNNSAAASFSGELCNTGANSRLCGRVARDAQSALGTPLGNQTGRTALTTTASADYFRRLSANETLQASLSAIQYSGTDALAGEKFRTTYVSAVIGYDRKIGRRFYTGVSAGARKLSRPGTAPDTDLNGYVYLRYHLGSGL
jgi:hypothetical protein